MPATMSAKLNPASMGVPTGAKLIANARGVGTPHRLFRPNAQRVSPPSNALNPPLTIQAPP